MIKVLMSNGEGEKITVILPKLLLFFIKIITKESKTQK